MFVYRQDFALVDNDPISGSDYGVADPKRTSPLFLFQVSLHPPPLKISGVAFQFPGPTQETLVHNPAEEGLVMEPGWDERSVKVPPCQTRVSLNPTQKSSGISAPLQHTGPVAGNGPLGWLECHYLKSKSPGGWRHVGWRYSGRNESHHQSEKRAIDYVKTNSLWTKIN